MHGEQISLNFEVLKTRVSTYFWPRSDPKLPCQTSDAKEKGASNNMLIRCLVFVKYIRLHELPFWIP